MAPHPAANSGSVVRIREASVAGTLTKAIDSTHNARAVVTNPVYKIPPKATGEFKIGEKSGSLNAISLNVPPCNNGEASNMRKDATITTASLIADTGRAASGFLAMIFSKIRYPIPNPTGWAKLRASPIVGAPPAPLSSTIATPTTATSAGTSCMTSNLAASSFSITDDSDIFWTLHISAIMATKTQCILQITHDFDAVVVSSPSVCPK
mmetsp:Transcript_2304/g.4868  ORF Transcript_2304/g.4868 Transcript_2304/m.4868 type:complete len:209 (-) Transcript_2304:470-1096(-)